MSAVRAEMTRFGFRFGAAKFERTCELPGERALVTITPDHGPHVDVYVSATGRSLRFFRDGLELVPDKGDRA